MIEDVILLVEDNATDEELTLRALRKANIANRVVVVRDGAAALDYVFARGVFASRADKEHPLVVLLDLNLPKVGGLDVLKAIRADPRTRTQPVVILTSSGEDRDVLEGYGNGANSYVVKPVEVTQFNEAVGQLGLYWVLVNRQPLIGR